MSELQIYLARNNQQAGPYSLEQLNQMLQSQQVLLTDLMWHAGMQEWKAIGELTQGQHFYQPQMTTSQNLSAPLTTSEQSFSTAQQSIVTGQTNDNYHINNNQNIKLASVGKRCIAKLVDWGILFIPQIILYASYLDQAFLNKVAQAQTSAEQNQLMLEFAQSLPNWVSLSALGYTLFILFIQNDLIRRSGQSFGKKLFKLQIVDITTNQITTSGRAFLIRSFVFFMLFQIAQVFPLLIIVLIVDFLMLFSKQNQTLHDRLAKTKVVDIAQ